MKMCNCAYAVHMCRGVEDEVQMCRCADVRRCRGAEEVHRCRAVQSCKDVQVQRFRGQEVQRFKGLNLKVQRFRGSEFRGAGAEMCGWSEVQRCRDAEMQRCRRFRGADRAGDKGDAEVLV